MNERSEQTARNCESTMRLAVNARRGTYGRQCDRFVRSRRWRCVSNAQRAYQAGSDLHADVSEKAKRNCAECAHDQRIGNVGAEKCYETVIDVLGRFLFRSQLVLQSSDLHRVLLLTPNRLSLLRRWRRRWGLRSSRCGARTSWRSGYCARRLCRNGLYVEDRRRFVGCFLIQHVCPSAECELDVISQPNASQSPRGTTLGRLRYALFYLG